MTYYYVAIHRADRSALLAGPYDTEEEAMAVKDLAWEKAEELDLWAWFYTVSLGKNEHALPTRFGRLNPEGGA